MYSARIKTNKGYTFNFGYDYGIIFDITPLSGVDVILTKSQNFQQIGEDVEWQSVQGIRRTIKGTIIRDVNKISEQMLQTLAAFTTGKLIFNDEYYCDVVVEKTPSISHPIGGKCSFIMAVYCLTPFWYTIKDEEFVIENWLPEFSFPVTYDSHKFGTKGENTFINAYNNGDVDSPFSVLFKSNAEIKNFGIVDLISRKKLIINETLTAGETVRFYKENNTFKLEKELSDGTKNNIFYALSDDSNLFSLKQGDNLLITEVEEGINDLTAIINFNETHMGVINK